MTESSPTLALAPLDPQQPMDVEREDSEEEEEGDVDLPLTVLPLFEPAIELNSF